MARAARAARAAPPSTAAKPAARSAAKLAEPARPLATSDQERPSLDPGCGWYAEVNRGDDRQRGCRKGHRLWWFSRCIARFGRWHSTCVAPTGRMRLLRVFGLALVLSTLACGGSDPDGDPGPSARMFEYTSGINRTPSALLVLVVDDRATPQAAQLRSGVGAAVRRIGTNVLSDNGAC